MTVDNGMPEAEKSPAAPTVTVNNTSTVVPTKKQHPEAAAAKCPLSTFDLPYITFYYNQKLLVYKTQEEEYKDIVEKLKSTLEDVLGHFYQLAGRIKQEEDGVLVVAVESEGCGEGVEVVEAAAEGVVVAELAEGEGGENAARLIQELVPYTGVMNLEGLHRPLLAVQFTKLKDGLVIGCAFNHAILDGNSTWHFMSSWAELCRGASSGVPSVLPLHDRTLARSVRVPLTLPSSPEAHEKLEPNGPPKPVTARLFSFSEPLVDLMKTNANAALPPEAKPFSAFQSLGAHVWRAVTRAREIAPNEITVFAIFADCRARLDPALPPAYFGNLIQAVFTGIPAGMLLSGPPELGAGLLQKAIDEHNAEAIVKKLEEYEASPKLYHYSDAGMNCVAVGSSPRFKVYDIDFGFGRPERVRSGSNNKCDGMVYLYPGRNSGRDIDVELTLQPEAMQRLEKDEEFLLLKTCATAA